MLRVYAILLASGLLAEKAARRLRSLMHSGVNSQRRRDDNSGPISRDIAILSLRYPLSRDTFSGRSALPQKGAIPPLGT